MSDNRISQLPVDVASADATSAVDLSQVVVDVGSVMATSEARVSQVVAEVGSAMSTSAGRWSQIVVQVLSRVVPTPPRYAVTIDGEERNPLLATFNIAAPLNGTAIMRADFDSAGSPFFRPGLDAEILVEEHGVPIFGGYITSIRERGMEGPNGVSLVVEVTAADYKAATQRRYVSEVITGGSGSPALTLKDILLVLEPYLTDYGITLDPAQVDGPAMESVTYDYRLLQEILDELSTITGYVWEIDVNKVLRMYPIGAVAAPFDLDETVDPPDYVGDITVEPTREQYANRIILRAGPNGPVMVTNTFIGDGITDTFTLTNQPLQWWVVVVNGTLYETIGTSPAYWSIDPGARTITRVAGIPALNDVIEITYIGQFPITLTAEDASEIALHGLAEFVVFAPDITDPVQAQALADAELLTHLTVLNRITYTTRGVGLVPGQTIVALVPSRNLSTVAVITEIVTHAEPGGELLVRDVTALEGDVAQGDWREIYRQWLA